MNSLQIVQWKLQNCKQSIHNYDKLLPISISKPSFFLLSRPIIGIQNNDKLEVIYGWNDVENFRNNNQKEIPAYILPDNMSFFELFEIIVTYFKNDNELNPIQISNLLSYIVSEIIDSKDLRKFTQLLGISAKEEIAKKYLSIQNIHNDIIQYLIKKKTPIKTWFLFAGIKKSDEWFFIDFTSKMNPSLSIVNEVIINLQESALRDKVALSDILDKINTQQYFTIDEPIKLLPDLRKDIFKIRYLEIFNHITEVNDILHKIKTPNNIKLQFDKSFETKNIQTIINISSKQDLEKAIDFFSGQNTDQLKSLLEKL